MTDKVGRNDNCPCGSGKKYKKCCLIKATESLIDLPWRRLRQLEDDLLGKQLIPYAMKLLPIEQIKAIADKIIPQDFPEEIDMDTIFTNFFIPWFLFNWTAEDGKTIAQQYSEKFPEKLNEQEKKYLAEVAKTYYSFYTVLAVEPEKAITIKDMLLDKEITVKEHYGTRYMDSGSIIFTRVLTFDDQSISVGMAPYVIAKSLEQDVIKLKQDYLSESKEKTLQPAVLKNTLEPRMIDDFFTIMKSSINLEENEY